MSAFLNQLVEVLAADFFGLDQILKRKQTQNSIEVIAQDLPNGLDRAVLKMNASFFMAREVSAKVPCVALTCQGIKDLLQVNFIGSCKQHKATLGSADRGNELSFSEEVHDLADVFNRDAFELGNF